MFTKFFNVFLVTILLCATQAAPSEAAGAEASEVAITEDSFKRFALSGAVLGKGAGLGVELETAMSPYLRVSIGVSTSVPFSHAIPFHFAWVPWGAQPLGIYLEGGASLVQTRECCGGPDVGGSAAETLLMPTAGLGLTYQGEYLIVKAGVDILYAISSEKNDLLKLPSARIGFRF